MDNIYQDDYVEALKLATKWKIQAFVAEGYAYEFSKKYSNGKPFAYPKEIRSEIKTMTNHFVKQHEDGIDIRKDPFFYFLKFLEKDPQGENL